MKPLIVWKLSRIAASQIECEKGCKRHARYGYSADGGAPYFYVCSKHVPVGVMVRFCRTSRQLIAEVERRNNEAVNELCTALEAVLHRRAKATGGAL